MKKLLSIFLLGTLAVYSINLSNDFIELKSELSEEFIFPEYSDVLNIITLSSGGCSASCSDPYGGTNSCSGTSNCICSCTGISCTCTLIGKDQKSMVEDVGRISISGMQYENIIKIAKYLHASGNESAYNAYMRLASMMEKLIERDFNAFIKERVKYLEFLDAICDSEVESGLSLVFEKIGI